MYKYVVLVIGLLLLSVTPTFAQNFPPYDFLDSPEYIRLREDNFAALDAYRREEREYQLDLAEYKKVQTLIAEDKAIQSLKEYVASRSFVLEKYFYALLFQVERYPSIEDSEREELTKRYTEQISYLQDHRRRVDAANESDEILELSAEFEAKKIDFDRLTYKTFSTFSLSRIMHSFVYATDTANGFKVDYIDTNESLQQNAIIRRGFSEIQLLNEKVQTSVDRVKQNIVAIDTPDKRGNYPVPSAVHANVIEILTPTFSDLKQIVTRLREMERLI